MRTVYIHFEIKSIWYVKLLEYLHWYFSAFFKIKTYLHQNINTYFIKIARKRDIIAKKLFVFYYEVPIIYIILYEYFF